MTDAQGVGKMFPGTLGGNARPAQPVGPPPAPRPRRWVPPIPPPLFYDYAVPRDYVVPAGISPPAGDDDDIRYSDSAAFPALYEAPGVTHDEPFGSFPLGNYDGSAIHWFVPGATDFTLEVNFWFVERDGSPTVAVTRGLRVRLIRDSDSTDIVNTYQTFTGTEQGPVQAQVIVGPFDILEPFSTETMCNWGTTAFYPSHAQHDLAYVGPPPWPIIGRGRLI